MFIYSQTSSPLCSYFIYSIVVFASILKILKYAFLLHVFHTHTHTHACKHMLRTKIYVAKTLVRDNFKWKNTYTSVTV